MAKKKKKHEPIIHPALFAFEGAVHYFNEGTILELHSQVTAEEWVMIVEETIKYKIFVDCLKEVAYPILSEKWSEEDDWFRVQLGLSVARMRNIDPLLVAKYNQEEIKKEYTRIMKDNASNMVEFIKQVKSDQAVVVAALNDKLTKVSDL